MTMRPKTRGKDNPMAQGKRRISRKRNRAIEGDVSTFIGPVARKVLDAVAELEKVSIAELTRIGIMLMIKHYREHSELPALDEHYGKMRPGRKRQFTEVEK